MLLEEALDILTSRPDYLENPAISEALEQSLSNLQSQPSADSTRVALISVLKQVSRLQWEPEQLSKTLRQNWGKSRLRELTLGELEALQIQLQSG